jgi:hypothetical protein
MILQRKCTVGATVIQSEKHNQAQEYVARANPLHMHLRRKFFFAT